MRDRSSPDRKKNVALLEELQVKAQAAERWVSAVNADGKYGLWRYAVARSPGEVAEQLDA